MAKKIRSFTAGQRTDSEGRKHNFSEADVRELVESYDPTVYEAPLCIGHPKTNTPAYGRVKSLEFAAGGHVDAHPHKVQPEFAEWVDRGLWDRVSISIWGRNSEGNPKPGKLYLRHIGFLGANPPAVHGLPVASFAQGGEVMEFTDWNAMSVAGLFRRIKNFFIDQFGQEKADAVIPEWDLEGLQVTAAQKPAESAQLSYSQPPAGDDVDPKEKEKLELQRKEQERKDAELREREQRLAADETKRRRESITARVAAVVKAGRLLPLHQEPAIAFAASLDGATTFEFGEGDKKQKKPSSDWFLEFLEAQPVHVDFSERSRAGGGEPGDLTADELARRANEYRQAEAKAGREISVTAAVSHVKSQAAAR